MVLETIYVTRHGFRSNWVVDPSTGTYYSNLPTPTGIPSDPALAAKGVDQSKELATHLLSADPPIDVVYSSPFYRCLQTLEPTIEALNADRSGDDKILIHPENGLGEFYGLARFDHPSPATLQVLSSHFPRHLKTDYDTPLIRPSTNGESLEALHDRIAYCLHHIIKRLDEDPKGPKTLLICTHAASMICIGRALTGRLPEDMGEDDFRCFTCALSRFDRRQKPTTDRTADSKTEEHSWDPENPEKIPDVNWKNGSGVMGGWDCVMNGDCSFLSQGEERGWRFSGDESFLRDPNAFNDAANEKAIDGEGHFIKGSGPKI
ncbi:hypothetical protein AAFC00_000212 [Neodothiora populina]|uniref:Phosphoglycerate mutase-like protein n=1 Tax=Neodothiora populina TaxID=2781224 RepID=A0ABR3P1S2_9PEZI